MVYEYLVEATLRIDAAGTEQTYYWSTHGRTTGPAESPANTTYHPRVIQPGTLQVDLYQQGTTSGATRYGYGAVVLTNTDGGLDALIDYGFAGQSIRVFMGSTADDRAAFVTLFDGVMDQPAFEWARLTLRARDRQYEIDRTPLQSSTYAGTNTGSPLAGVEGTASDIKGRRKPLVYGKVSNVAPIAVNTDRYIFQVSDVELSSVDAVYDNGIALSAGAAYASQSAMESTAPSAGAYRAWLAGGCIRVGTKPVGQITADVTQGANAAARTAGQVMQALALRAGVASGDISATDVTALDSACSYVVGTYIADGRSAIAALDQIANSIGAWYGFDSAGVFRMGRMTAPTGTPTLDLDDTNILAISRQPLRESGDGVPAWRVTINYWRNWTPQKAALNASVTTARRAYVEREALTAVAEDSTIQAQHPLAVELTFDTLLTAEADAAAEAARRLALYSVRRDRLRARIYLTQTTAAALALGAVVQVTLPRYGMDAGKPFLLIGMTADYSRNAVDLDLWG